MQGMWDAWARGDRKGAVEAIPDEVVDDLVVHGSPAECAAKLDLYRAAGVNTVVIALPALDPEVDLWSAVAALGLGC